MPIYEYRRPDGSTFEVMQSFSEEALTHDPETGVEVQRVLHAPAVHFKGKGFYNTDYGTRNRQRETAAAAEGSSGGDSGGDSVSKGDSTSGGADAGSSTDKGSAEKGSSEKSSSASDGKAKPAKDASTSKAPAAAKG
jgi:putative FmdB family regulatory protein